MSSSFILTDLSRLETARLGFDPQTQPLLDLPLLPDIAQPYLNSDFIRASFSHPVQWGVEPLFSSEFVADFSHQPQNIPSAVCVPLVQREHGLTMLLTRRSGHLPSHAGQVCFPGGRIDLSDNNATHTALRETFEEVGIAPSYIQPLGEQPIFLTGSRYAMRPVISLVKEGFSIEPNPSEVAQVFEVPLSILMSPSHHRLHSFSTTDEGQKSRYYFSISWNGYFIWGATAVVIRNFYHYLSAASKQINI